MARLEKDTKVVIERKGEGGLDKVEGDIAVSYTHLDVYKRQGYMILCMARGSSRNATLFFTTIIIADLL